MKNTNITSSNPLEDEVEVDLDVLDALMLSGVGGHVHRADVVTIDQDGSTERSVKFLEKLAQPRSLCNSIGNSAILGFCTGARNSLLPLKRPGDQIVTEEHSKAPGRLARVRTTSPISIRVDNQLSRRRRPEK